jgi:hypothetical protein
LILYHGALIWLTEETIGKALVGLRVRRSGKKVGLLWALGRSSIGYFVVDVFGMGAAFALLNPDHKCLHDYVFDSEVVVQGNDSKLIERLLTFSKRLQDAVDAKQEPFNRLRWLVKALAISAVALAVLLSWLRRRLISLTGRTPTVSTESGTQAGGTSLHKKAAIFATTAVITWLVVVSPPGRGIVGRGLVPRLATNQPGGGVPTHGQTNSPAVSATEALAYGWGANTSGQLGDGTTTDRLSPVAVNSQTMPRLTQVAASRDSASEDYTVALAEDGTAWAWGANDSGQLGSGNVTNTDVPVAVTMPAGVTFTALATGGGGCCRGHTIALDSTGKAWAWGSGAYGVLGNGATENSRVPVPVTMPPGVTFKSVGAGPDNSYAVSTDGTGYAWGDDGQGELGTNWGPGTNVPVPITMPAGVQFAAITAGLRL